MSILGKMKSLLITSAAGIMLLCGCSLTESISGQTGNAPKDIDKLYTAEAEITVSLPDEDTATYCGTLTRLGGGSWELLLRSPESVSGLKIALGEEGITASLGELNFRLETEKIPARAAFMTLFGVLDNAAYGQSELTFAETETDLCWYGTFDGSKYTLCYDKVSNTLCGLETGNIEVRFSAFTVTGSDNSTSSETVTSETAAPAESEASASTAAETTAPTETKVPETTTTTAAATSRKPAQTAASVTR